MINNTIRPYQLTTSSPEWMLKIFSKQRYTRPSLQQPQLCDGRRLGLRTGASAGTTSFCYCFVCCFVCVVCASVCVTVCGACVKPYACLCDWRAIMGQLFNGGLGKWKPNAGWPLRLCTWAPQLVTAGGRETEVTGDKGEGMGREREYGVRSN